MRRALLALIILTLCLGVSADGKAPVVPAVYKMFDYGTDYASIAPWLGPVGSDQFYTWEALNPDAGVYNWDLIESELNKERGLYVSVDGNWVQKPVHVFIVVSLAPSGSQTWRDLTPQWVYRQMVSAGYQPDSYGGRYVGHRLIGCGDMAMIPAYDNPLWRARYLDFIRAFGAEYDDDPSINSVVIAPGLDGESAIVKDYGCNWSRILNEQAPGVEYRFGQFVTACMDVYAEAFPSTELFLSNTTSGEARRSRADYAVSKGIGLKNAGLAPDLESWDGLNTTATFTMNEVYSTTVPQWMESKYGLGDLGDLSNPEPYYWALLAGLHYRPVGMSLHPEYLDKAPKDFLWWVSQHLRYSLDEQPSVWTVFRDREYEPQCWTQDNIKRCVSGHIGDWSVGLARVSNTDVRVWREEGDDDYRGRQFREGDFVLDVDDSYQRVAYETVVTYRDVDNIEWSLTYQTPYGYRGIGFQNGNTGYWRKALFPTSDLVVWGGENIKIMGGVKVHMVEVRGLGDNVTPTQTSVPIWTPTMTPTFTPEPTFTPIPTVIPTITPELTEWQIPAYLAMSVALDLQQQWYGGDVPAIEQPFYKYARAHGLGLPTSGLGTLCVEMNGETITLHYVMYGKVVLVHDIAEPWKVAMITPYGEPQ